MIGEQVFDAAGQRWTLFLGNAAQCAIEAQYDRGFFAVVADAMPNIDPQTAMAIAAAMSDGGDLSPALAEKATTAMKAMRQSVLRDLAWHGLQRHHPDLSPDDVSDIIDDLGSDRFGTIMGTAIRAAQGQGGGDGAAQGKPRAIRPKGRTGRSGSKSGAASA